MKKGINIKNVIVSLVFLIIGIGMLLFVLFVVLPAMTHNAEVVLCQDLVQDKMRNFFPF